MGIVCAGIFDDFLACCLYPFTDLALVIKNIYYNSYNFNSLCLILFVYAGKIRHFPDAGAAESTPDVYHRKLILCKNFACYGISLKVCGSK